jgi:hypothetical protein
MKSKRGRIVFSVNDEMKNEAWKMKIVFCKRGEIEDGFSVNVERK